MTKTNGAAWAWLAATLAVLIAAAILWPGGDRPEPEPTRQPLKGARPVPDSLIAPVAPLPDSLAEAINEEIDDPMEAADTGLDAFAATLRRAADSVRVADSIAGGWRHTIRVDRMTGDTTRYATKPSDNDADHGAQRHRSFRRLQAASALLTARAASNASTTASFDASLNPSSWRAVARSWASMNARRWTYARISSGVPMQLPKPCSPAISAAPRSLFRGRR